MDASTGLATKDEASEDDDEEVWENSTNQIAVVAGLGGVMLLGSVICLYQAKKKPPTTVCQKPNRLLVFCLRTVGFESCDPHVHPRTSFFWEVIYQKTIADPGICYHAGLT